MVRSTWPRRGLLSLAVLAAFAGGPFIGSAIQSNRALAQSTSDRPRAQRQTVVRLGSTEWRIGNCNWLAYAPDGKSVYGCCITTGPNRRFSSAATDVIRQIDARTGRELRRVVLPAVPGEPNVPSALDKRIASVSVVSQLVAFYAIEPQQSTVHVWDMAHKRLLWSLPQGSYLVTLSAPGKLLAWQDDEQPWHIHVADARTGKERRQFVPHLNDHFHTGYGTKMLFSADERFLAFAFWGGLEPGRLTVWDVTTGKEALTTEGPEPTGWISSLIFAPGSNILALRIHDKVSLWDIPRRRQYKHWPGWNYLCEAFSPDGKTLLLGWDKLYLWRVGSGKKLRALTSEAGASGGDPLAFSPDDKEIVGIAGSTLRRWNVATGQLQPLHTVHVSALKQIAFRRDGAPLFSLDSNGVAALWDADSGANWWHQGGNEGYVQGDPAVSPDGKTLATFAADKAVWLRDANNGHRVRQVLPAQKEDPPAHISEDRMRLIFTDDGKSLLCLPTTVEYLQPRSGFIIPLEGHATPETFEAPGYDQNDRRKPEWYTVEAVYAPNGRWYAMGNWYRSGYDSRHRLIVAPDVRIGSLRPVHQTITFPVPRDPKKNVQYVRSAFAADGRTLAVLVSQATPERQRDPSVTAYLVETATGQARAHFQFKTFGLGWSDGTLVTDGRFLAYADTNHFSHNPIRVWDFVTGHEVARCQPEANVCCLALAPGGRALATGMADGTAMVWQLPGPSGPPSVLSERELEQAWQALATPDAHEAFLAMHRLAADPAQAVPFLRARLHAVAPSKSGQVQQFIADLDSDDFASREKASQALAHLGPTVHAALRRALAANPSPEVRRRIEHLLKGKGHSERMPVQLRELRAVELLERIGSPAARQVLATLARGDEVAPLTREARASHIRAEAREKQRAER